MWKRARVDKLIKGRDGKVRPTRSLPPRRNTLGGKELTRPIQLVIPLENRNIYPLLTMPTPYEKETEHLRKLFVAGETDEDSDFDYEVNEPGNVLEEKFFGSGKFQRT
ncbi:hypothetical protein AVEN_90670-1 [Araneus ventricosus]|uniref:Uncharacterized protein n=1 Tax=Araneus ventricosus TaxID=182803 RepID=A0A4Y2F482_ARAVE|nr:hypothetical protein AVEN_90670-1 [Araneus ventricosus]